MATGSLKRVNTATLLRGEVYSFRHPYDTPQNPKESLRFERDVPKVIEDKEILEMLEELYDELEDGEGEVYEKPTFRIDRGVAPPDDPHARRRHRLKADREVKRRPRKRN